MTVNVTPDNDPPTIQTGVDTPDDASDDTSGVADVTTPEDTTYVFTLDDFNYVDQDNDPLDSVYLTQGAAWSAHASRNPDYHRSGIR